MRKFKFAYNKGEEKLYFSPLVFPTWDFRLTGLGHSLFRDVPFGLPFSLPEHIDTRNKGALLRTYYNIYFVYAVSLAKAFVQEILLSEDLASKVVIRRSDLDAVLGANTTTSFIDGIGDFITSTQSINFSLKQSNVSYSSPKSQYASFAAVIDDLKGNYEQLAEKNVPVSELITISPMTRSLGDLKITSPFLKIWITTAI